MGKRVTLRIAESEKEQTAERTLESLSVGLQTPARHEQILRSLGVPESRRQCVVLGRVWKKLGYGAVKLPKRGKRKRAQRKAKDPFDE